MADIFISYSSRDRALADALAKALKSRGFSVWWDFNLVGGQRFREQIHEQLTAARAVIVIWTEDSVASKWVRDEADEADRLGKLIPLRVPRLPVHEVPLGHRQTQICLYSDGERILVALAELGVGQEDAARKHPFKIKAPAEKGQTASFLRWVGAAGAFMAAIIVAYFTGKQATPPVPPKPEAPQVGACTGADWSEIRRSSNLELVRGFAARCKGGDFGKLAEEELSNKDKAAWDAAARTADTVEAYQAYLRDWPQGAFATGAAKKLERFIRAFTGHTNNVLSVAFSPDGRTALSGSQDNTLKLWDLTGVE